MQALPPASDNRRNFIAFAGEGGFFVGGLGFINLQTLLPSLILENGGSQLLAAMAPSLMIVGLFGVPIFTASRMGKVRHLGRTSLAWGVLQRAPIVIAAPVLLFAPLPQSAIVWVLALAPFLSGVFGGIAFSVWQRMFILAVPDHLRVSNISIRFLIGGVTGFLAGYTIKVVLAEYPGATGYGILHACAGAMMIFSWITLAVARVPVQPLPDPATDHSEKETFGGFVRSVFSNNEEGRNIRLFSVAIVCFHTFFLPAPFAAVYFRSLSNEPVSFLGVLAIYQMIASTLGNFMAGWVGHRFGSRVACSIGLAITVLSLIASMFIQTSEQSKWVYGASWFGLMMMIVGKDAFLMEMRPSRFSSHYLSAMALLTVVGMVGSSLLSAILWANAVPIQWMMGGGAILMTVGIFLLLSIRRTPSDLRQEPFLQRPRRGLMRYFR